MIKLELLKYYNIVYYYSLGFTLYLPIATSNHDTGFIWVLNPLILASVWEHPDILVIIEAKDKALPAAIEPWPDSPLLAAVCPKDPIVLILNEDQSVVTTFQVLVEGQHAHAIVVYWEQ